MKIEVYNVEENTRKVVESPFNVKAYAEINSFGLFGVSKIKTNHYALINKFDGNIVFEMRKVG